MQQVFHLTQLFRRTSRKQPRSENWNWGIILQRLLRISKMDVRITNYRVLRICQERRLFEKVTHLLLPSKWTISNKVYKYGEKAAEEGRFYQIQEDLYVENTISIYWVWYTGYLFQDSLRSWNRSREGRTIVSTKAQAKWFEEQVQNSGSGLTVSNRSYNGSRRRNGRNLEWRH